MTKKDRNLEYEVLDVIKDNAKCPYDEIARLLGVKEQEVAAVIRSLEDKGIIVKYKTVINWNKVDNGEKVTSLIEVKVIPKRGYGFDKVAERIYQFDEVKSLYLISGGYDLMAVVEGDTLRQVAAFVSEKLSTLDDVQSTATHFMLKTYKEDGDIMEAPPTSTRLEVSP